MESGAPLQPLKAAELCCVPLGAPLAWRGDEGRQSRWDVSTQEQDERSVCFPWLQIPLGGIHPPSVGFGVGNVLVGPVHPPVPGLWGCSSCSGVMVTPSPSPPVFTQQLHSHLRTPNPPGKGLKSQISPLLLPGAAHRG